MTSIERNNLYLERDRFLPQSNSIKLALYFINSLILIVFNSLFRVIDNLHDLMIMEVLFIISFIQLYNLILDFKLYVLYLKIDELIPLFEYYLKLLIIVIFINIGTYLLDVLPVLNKGLIVFTYFYNYNHFLEFYYLSNVVVVLLLKFYDRFSS